jgi:hypothetical protein
MMLTKDTRRFALLALNELNRIFASGSEYDLIQLKKIRRAIKEIKQAPTKMKVKPFPPRRIY